jgi:hypothetical protein
MRNRLFFFMFRKAVLPFITLSTVTTMTVPTTTTVTMTMTMTI